MRKLFLMIFSWFFYFQIVYCPALTIQQKEILNFEIKKHFFVEEIRNKPMTSGLFIQALKYELIDNPEIVHKQAVIEAGWFTSQVFLEGNNPIGMRLAKFRPTTAIGEIDCHAKYSSWHDAVVDYGLWQKWYKARGYDMTDYYTFLHEIGYAIDKRYIKKLKEII